jgi:hypothetical protein
MAPELQSALQSGGMLPTAGPGFRFSRSHLPTSAYFLKRQACFSAASVKQHHYSSTLLPVWGTLASERKDLESSAAPILPADPVIRSDQLPPLVSSTVIPGLPPPPSPASVSQLHEAEQRLKRIAERWNLQSFELWTQTGISFSDGLHGGTVDTDRLVAISTFYTIFFMLDDLFFDAPNALALKEYGVHGSVCQSVETINAFLKHLHSLFRQQAPLPESPTPFEGIMWELGHDMRRLSTPGWFSKFADTVMEYQEASISCHASHNITGGSQKDTVEDFARMRIKNCGGRFVMLLVEFAHNVFLPDQFRAHPTLQELTDAATTHGAYVNDLFSYSKEALEEPSNARNLLMLLMGSSGGSGLSRAAWEAVGLIKSQARIVTELEKKLDLEAEPEAFAVRTYVDGVKSLMAGNFHWHTVDKRYRHPDSVFPELRRITN